MTHARPVIVWFRQDLRLADNPALHAAARTGAAILPIYILSDADSTEWHMGQASRWWLHHSLQSLSRSLDDHLVLLRGDAGPVLQKLVTEVDASAIYWNRLYEPDHIARDSAIRKSLLENSVAVKSFNGSLLFDPMSTMKPDGTPYRVFTPFYRRGCLENSAPPRQPLAKPESLDFYPYEKGLALSEQGLLPQVAWYREIESLWTPGEPAAHERLREFLASGIEHYDEGRNRPDQTYVSRLSPHLHFGEISPNQAWYAIATDGSAQGLSASADRFLSELGWREFSYNLLYNVPTLPTQNLQKKFDRFPWRDDATALERWQRGSTGYPIVDAGMRELWRTGYMHNRVRMIVGSFLVKNLLLHWHHGARWFWDTLLDADLASNSASWQWIAGCGADAAPYFRIFNPVTQGKKFDPDGHYVRHFVPELELLPTKYIHCPWEAPDDIAHEAKLVLGENYPRPIVDLKASRERALAAFQSLTGNGSVTAA
jgi:deoxyribodipyrimidine photo-lyase